MAFFSSSAAAPPWIMLPQEMACGSAMTCWRRLRDWQQAGSWGSVSTGSGPWLIVARFEPFIGGRKQALTPLIKPRGQQASSAIALTIPARYARTAFFVSHAYQCFFAISRM